MVALADTLADNRPQYDIDQWQPGLTGYYSLKLASTLFAYEGGSQPWSIAAAGTDGVRFELRDGDVAAWDAATGHASERDEIATRGDVAQIDQALEISYKLMLDPGAANTADWMVLGQLHQNLEDVTATGGPVFGVYMNGNEKLSIQARYQDADGKTVTMTLWTDQHDIVRGQTYDIDIKVIADPTGASGRLVVTLDGTTIVDYQGPLGDSNMTGVYWAEGIYRDEKATETVVATFSDLTIKTGGDVLFPAPSAFIAAPELGSDAIAASSTAGAYDITLSGTAKAGATVTVYDGTTAVGSAKADDLGNVTVAINAATAGSHDYYAVASDASGRSGVTASPVEVLIGTAAGIGRQLVALAGDANITMIHVTDGNMLDVGTSADLATITHSARLMAALDDAIYLRTTDTISGKAYDREVHVYDKAGTLIEVDRYAGTRLVFETLTSGSTVSTATWATDGSATYTVKTGGTTVVSANFSASGTMSFQQITSAGGTKESDTYGADGSLTRAVVSHADGTRTEAQFGITGRDYVKQATTYDAAGKQILTARFDASGKVVAVIDAAQSTTTSFQYDAGGQVASYRIARADGSYSISTLSGGDVTTRSYTVLGVLVSTDHSDPAAGVLASGLATMSGVQAPAGSTLAALLISSDYGDTTPGSSSYTPSVAAITAAEAAASAQTAAATDAAAAAAVTAAGGTNAATASAAPPAAPELALSALSSTTDGHVVTLSGTAGAGNLVKLYDDGQLVATATADAAGGIALAVAADAGTHSYTATASANGSADSVASAGLDIVIGSAADILNGIDTLALDGALAAISAGGSQIVDVAGMSIVTEVAKHPETVAKLEDTLLMRVTTDVSGKSYDEETRIYDTAGTLIQAERSASGTAVLSASYLDGSMVATNWNADGSRTTQIVKDGKSYLIDSYDSQGRLASHTTGFSDGARQTDWYDAGTGAVSRTVVQNADGSHIDSSYGITGKSYASQSIAYDSAGHITYSGQFDAAGRLVAALDATTHMVASYQYSATTGLMASARLTGADGSYTVTAFGPDGDTVLKTSYYSSTGALLKEDGSNPLPAVSIASLVAESGSHAGYADLIMGGAGNDTLKAGATGAVLWGGGGDDTLVGGAGDDILIGGPGKDVMTGGGGHDLFHFSPGDFASATMAGADRITDFSQGDRIDLSSFENAIAGHAGFTLIGSAAYSGHAGELQVFEQGGSTYVGVDLNGDKMADFMLQLDGAHMLARTDFIL